MLDYTFSPSLSLSLSLSFFDKHRCIEYKNSHYVYWYWSSSLVLKPCLFVGTLLFLGTNRPSRATTGLNSEFSFTKTSFQTKVKEPTLPCNLLIVLYTQLCLYEQRGTHIYKNISLVLFSKEDHSLLFVWEIDGETYTQRGDFLSHIFFLGLGGTNACTPCKPYRQRGSRRFWSAACPWLDSRFWLDWLSKSNRVVLISRGLLPVTHLLGRATPTHYHAPVY